MNLRTKTLYVFISLLLIFVSFVYTFLIFKGRSLTIEQLERITQRKVTIGYFDLLLPAHIQFKNLKIEGLADIESIRASFSFLGFLTGKIILNEVVVMGPRFTYERVSPEKTVISETVQGAAVEPAKSSVPEIVRRIRVKKQRVPASIIKKLVIKGAIVDFIDRTVPGEPLKITAQNVNVVFYNVYSSSSPDAVTSFDVKGTIPWMNAKVYGNFEAKGWVNFARKDMEGSFKVKDIDGVHLAPYYAQLMNVEKANVKQARLNFTSEIRAVNNKASIHYRLELSDVLFDVRPDGGQEPLEERIAHKMFDVLQQPGQPPRSFVLESTFPTRLDRFQFSMGKLKVAVEETASSRKSDDGPEVFKIIQFPSKFIAGTMAGATEITTTVIKSTIAVGKELRRSLKRTSKSPK